MKAGWELKALGDVCRLLNGRAYKKPELLSHGKYPVLRVGNFFTNNNWYFSDLELPEDKYCDNGDLLYAWSASFGPRVWEGGKVIYHYHIWKVEPKAQQIDKSYLYYFFDWDKERIKNEQGAGTTMIHVSKTSMDARKIPLPPLEEQKRIVSILDEAFEGLDRARENAEANLKSARELFERATTSLFSSAAINCSLVALASVANLDRGHNPPKKDFIYEPRKGYVRFYQIRDRKSDNHAVYVPVTTKLHTVKPTEILMTAYRHIGEVFRGADGAFNVALCKLSSKCEEVLLNDYLFAIIPTDYVKGELLRYSERSLIPSMSVKHLQTIEIPLPDIQKQSDIIAQLKKLQRARCKTIDLYQTKLQDISDLRQSLLQKAFAGELT